MASRLTTRILILDHYYEAFASDWYGRHAGLAAARYADQRQSFDEALFGETTFEIGALRALGYEASDSIVNLRPAQEAFARENSIRLPGTAWVVRRRGRYVRLPWRRQDPRWVGVALLAQVDTFKPDVVHVQCMDYVDPSLIKEIKGRVRLVIGQIAAPLHMSRALAGYDLVVSSLPNLVTSFREAGLDSELLPLAFEPSLVDRIPSTERDIPVSFVGSLSRSHQARIALLERIAARRAISIWSADTSGLGRSSALRASVVGAAWGADMYRVLGRSRITINTHIDMAAGNANNLRLYEATGMGALLITDRKSNLGELFDIDQEVVAFDNAEGCLEAIDSYVARPTEAAAIAQAGQRRTLSDHTWIDRMARLSEMIRTRM